MNWEKKPLAAVAEFRLGKMLDEKKNKGDLMPYLANLNVQWGEFDLTDLREMRFEHHELETFGLQYGDIVMCEGGEPGRCAIWKEQIPGTMIQKALHRIRPGRSLHNEFLYYSFLNMRSTGHFATLFTGATIKHLPKEKLALLEVAIPPYSVQTLIAGILSDYDTLIENNGRRMALLEESARLLYREWFGRLRFPGHEGTKIVDGIPAGWSRTELGDVLTLKRGHDLPEQNRLEGEIPVVSSSGITGWHNAKKADPPGIVTGRYGTLGEVYYIDTEYWPLNTALYVSDFKAAEPLFAFYLLQATLNTIQSDKAAVPGVNRNVLHAMPVLLPPASLRIEFVTVVNPMREMISKLMIQNEKLRGARDMLLPRLMSGEVKV